jgi:hypothetical protein
MLGVQGERLSLHATSLPAVADSPRQDFCDSQIDGQSGDRDPGLYGIQSASHHRFKGQGSRLTEQWRVFPTGDKKDHERAIARLEREICQDDPMHYLPPSVHDLDPFPMSNFPSSGNDPLHLPFVDLNVREIILYQLGDRHRWPVVYRDHGD